MSTRAPESPSSEADEFALLDAITAMLRAKRGALMQGDMSEQALAPMWQPLLDRLGEFGERRATGGAEPPSARLAAQADALRQEYEALQHSLQLWSDALRMAHGKSSLRPAEPVYGQAAASAPRASLGRG